MKKTKQELIKMLLKAYVGESLARLRYTFYAKVARKENLFKLEEIFLITSENELEHAEWFSRMIKSIDPNFEIEEITLEEHLSLGNSIANLETAIQGENYENSKFYLEIAKLAEDLNYLEIAKRVRAIAIAEKHHEERFRKFLDQLKNNTLLKKEKNVYWVCRKCGYIHYGKEPPSECPSCGHSKEYYELMNEEY
ncbi:MAG: rubrerythrin family protein [Candidatus Woesearchaeota archaeon]